MKQEEFEEWLTSFVDHYNFISEKSPTPHTIGFRCALVQKERPVQAVDIYYSFKGKESKEVFLRERNFIPPGAQFGSEEDWEDTMQRVLIEIMTAGTFHMVDFTMKR